MRRFVLVLLLCIISMPLFAQGVGNLDDTWSIWMMTQDQDPHVRAPTYWKQVEYRWRRTGKPSYHCEVEFRNPGTTARNFKYEILYQDNIPPLFQHHKHTGELLTVTGTPRQVTIAGCHDVDPSPSVYARQTSAKPGLPASWSASYTDPLGNSCTETESASVNGNTLIYHLAQRCSEENPQDWTYVVSAGAVNVSDPSTCNGTNYCVGVRCKGGAWCIRGVDGPNTDDLGFTFASLQEARAAAAGLRALLEK